MSRAGSLLPRCSVVMALLLNANLAFAQQCATSIESTDQMTFTQDRIQVSRSCRQFTVTLKHSGQMPKTVMGHNWVLSRADDVQSIAADGISAGASQNFLKPSDTRVIAHTRLIGGGDSDSVTFDTSNLQAGQSYAFFCSFPGHWAMMKGKLELVD